MKSAIRPVALPIVYGFCFIVLLVGCGQDSSILSARIAELEKKVDGQEKAIARLEETNAALIETNTTEMGNSLAQLFSKLEDEVRVEVLKIKQEVLPSRFASLDPTSKGYSVVTTEKAVFLFSIDRAEPYLDGHKIFLRIGNLANATFSGFKLTVHYAKRKPVLPSLEPSGSYTTEVIEKYQKERESWANSIRTAQVSFTDDLEPGAWNVVDFTLKETKAEEISYLEIGIETDDLKLRKPLKELLTK